ncbi:MAG: hypothetical protein JSV86_10920 [Gemmatimonadota bacterium]|nr:MAG: hypothetical protein JSV86_10920 [Gemmatimonadota bacterium]
MQHENVTMLGVMIPTRMHRELKELARANRTTMTAIASRLLTRFLEGQGLGPNGEGTPTQEEAAEQ